MHYQYNFAGRLLITTYQKDNNTEIFQHFYEYDYANRLKKVLTRDYNGRVNENVQYYFSTLGTSKRIELGQNLQGLDYVYTIDGNLKAINHPYLDNKDPGGDSYTGTNSHFKQDVFGMMLEYYDNDYVNGTKFQTSSGISSYAQQYNGNIRAWTWNTRTTTPPTPAQYCFTYDKKYQLIQADFGTHSTSTNTFTVDANASYKSQMTYDANGNILTKLQKINGGTTKQNDTYAFTSGTNKLSGTTSTNNRSFTYDASGRMKSYVTAVSGEQTKYLDYDGAGMVTAVYKDVSKTQPLVKYEYDEAGQRIRKINFNQSTYAEETYTWYVNDAKGTVVAIYETTVSTTTTTLKENFVYGTSRVATYYRQTAEYDYELKDHLGNVRATVHRHLTTGNVEVLSYTDYYPWGEEMPGRQLIPSPDTRYGYQGEFAEKETELNWNSFDLRMYDPILGRWISPDPYNQYHSPYMAMGNNPVNMIDPDGGFSLGGAPVEAGLRSAGRAAWNLGVALQFAAASSSGIIWQNRNSFLFGDGSWLFPEMSSTSSQYNTASSKSIDCNFNQMFGSRALRKKLFEKIDRALKEADIAIILGQTSMMKYRTSVSIHKRVGSLMKFYKSYKLIGKVGKAGGVIGSIFTVASLIDDYHDPDVSAGRFTFRVVGNMSAIAAGAIIGAGYGGPIGGAAGLTVGVGFELVEYGYDNAYVPWSNAVTETLHWFIKDLANRAISSQPIK